jgi:choline monooxygenase
MPRLFVDPDIRRAATLPSAIHGDPLWFERTKDAVFAPSWQLISPESVPPAGEARPFVLLPGFLDEPLLLATDERGTARCLSNVCTHRANLLLDAKTKAKALRCGYHGRCFGLDGRMLSMPRFEDASDFPGPRDDLAALPLASVGPLLFTRLVGGPEAPSLERLLAPLFDRVGFLPWARLGSEPPKVQDYSLEAGWMLYLDNYLEGFHIPWVHPGLDARLSRAAYTTELFPDASLQIGDAAAGEPAFALPAGHPDQPRRVAGYYFWLFPNTMINVYPWGLSINLVQPLAPARTRIRYLTHVWEPALVGQGAGTGLESVEAEDEAIVERVQRGVRARLYSGGRFSPAMETGVHHFHRILAERLG